MLAELLTVENLIALFTLTSLEIVLGIDNIVFIAILAGRLPPEQRDFARKMGLSLAVFSRIALLFSISWIMELKKDLFSIPWFGHTHSFAGKDLILIFGGLFLIYKATKEIYHKVEGHDDHDQQLGTPKTSTLKSMLIQVMFIDIVFSLDSVITAVGMCSNLIVMIASILISVGVMLIFSGYVVTFIDRNPSIKVLALSFLLMIGVLLVGEGFHHEIPKGYIYFAMFFSLMMDLLQMRMNKKTAHPSHVTKLSDEKPEDAGIMK